MNKFFIGISTRIVNPTNYNEKRDAISHDLISILDKLGFIPILIPNNLSNTINFLDQFTFAGFIISGGDNIGDYPQRDKTENMILQYSSKKNIPTLGICRGMQVINNFFGGKIRLDESKNHVNTKHPIKIINEKFKIIFKSDSIDVNSYHNNIIKLEDLGHDIMPFATYDDTIEGFYHKHLPIIGIMWHPEREQNYQNQLNLMKHFYEKLFWNE